jgi:hypothetical protein
MLPPIPYRPFAIRMALRSVIIWIGIHAFTAAGGSVVLEWQAAVLVVLLTGSLAYGDAVRCHEPLFLGNCGVPRTSLVLFTFGAAFFLELALYTSYAVWITS